MIILRFLALLLAFTFPLRAQLVLSEFLASNSNSLADEDGQQEDWIEIQNPTASPVSLLGWYLTDDANQPRKWAFPARTLNAGSYLVVFASSKDRKPASGNLHTNFKLATEPDYLALTHDLVGGGIEVVTVFNPYPQQANDISFGVASTSNSTVLIGTAAAAKAHVPASGVLGATWTGAAANEPFDDSAWLSGTTGVGYGDGVGVIGLANLKQRLNSDSAAGIVADTSGASRLALNNGAAWVASSTDAAAPPKTRVGLMQFVAAENDQVSSAGHTDYDQAQCTVTFWMRSAGVVGTGSEAAMLWDRRAGVGVGVGTVIAQHTNGTLFFQAGNSGVRCVFNSVGQVSNDRWHHVAVVMNTAAGGTNTFYIDGAASGSGVNTAAWGWTGGTAIELGRSHDPYWFRYNGLMDDVRFYNRQLTAPEIAQIAAGADDDSVSSGLIGLNVQSQMQNNNASAYLRVPFTVNDPAAFATLRLSQQWNDGFVAYVNGTQITAQNAPAAVDWNSNATGTHNASIADTYDYALPPGLLRTGSNILAIQGLNVTAADASFLMLPKLDGLTAAVVSTGYNSTLTPGAANSAVRTNVGPFVSEVTKNPPRPTGTAASPDLIVSAKVTPSLRPLAAASPVQLKYRIMYAAEQSLDMTPTGVADTFSARIPTGALGAGQMLRWRVVATDNSGVSGTGPAYSDPNDNEQYYGTVALDSTIQTNLPVLYWFIQNLAPVDADTPTRCSLFYKAFGDPGPGRFYDNVLADRHGQSSGGFAKKSYNFDFNEDNRFEWNAAQNRTKDMDLLTNWGDKSKTHNQMSHEAFATVGSVHHWCHQVRVHQVTPTNAGTPANHFFSIADMLEDGDEDFLERNGRDPNGALYKVYDSLAGAGGSEKKTRQFEGNADLTALITGLNVANPIVTRRQFAYDNLDLPQCVSYFVGCILTSHQDHGHKNYYVYRDTLGTREWSPLPWDVDLSWGRNWQDSPGYFTDTIFTDNELDMYKQVVQNKGENRLYSLFVGNSDAGRAPAPEFRDMVLRRLRSVMDSYFSAPGLLENRFAQLADLMDPPAIGASDADRDRAKWGTWGNDAGNTAGGLAMRYHIDQIRNVYLPGRRTFLNSATLAGATVPASQPANAHDLITIETVDFNPTTGNQGHEYFVIRNSNTYAVDISGWKITGAVNWTFKPGTVLPPGGGLTEHRGDIFVAKDPFLFRQGATVTGGRQFAFVQGPYSGQLSARGENIELRDPNLNLLKTKSWTPAPTPAQNQLRITELNYAPSAATDAERAALAGVVESDFEYIELMNTGETALTLGGARFEAGVDFVFPAGFTLAAGARCLVVANLAAFQLRYGHAFDAQIAGAFDGSLDNGGETIQLVDNVGENILDFRYESSWLPPSDEGGRSLVFRNSLTDWQTYGFATSWGLSGDPNGSPGTGDTDFATVYEGWRHDHFSTLEFPTTQNPDAPASVAVDAEGDGLSNLGEYAFGRNPRTGDNSALTAVSLVDVGGTPYAAITFTRRHKAIDLTWTVQASSDLVTWTPVDLPIGAPEDLGGGVERVTYRDSQPAAGEPRFLRVRAAK